MKYSKLIAAAASLAVLAGCSSNLDELQQ